MDDFPDFMKTADNSISPVLQSHGVEGWIYDGKDGKQMAYWKCVEDVNPAEHVHDYDEYFVVIQGVFILNIEGKDITIGPGQEYHIPAGLPHAGRAKAGTRTIHCFGGKRA